MRRSLWGLYLIVGTLLVACSPKASDVTTTGAPMPALTATALPTATTTLAQTRQPSPSPMPSKTPMPATSTPRMPSPTSTDATATREHTAPATLAVSATPTSEQAKPSAIPASATATPEPPQPSASPVPSTPTSSDVAPPQTPVPASPTPPPTDPAPAYASSGAVRLAETQLVLQTYGYEAGFQATEPGDPVYPYPRLDPEKVTSPQPRSYRAIVLENDYVSLTILPELGGRIYRWVDKATGRHLLYENPVVKPTSWGYRGWWLAAGGIEWAFPVEEHGLNEWRPWNVDVRTLQNGVMVVVSDVEERTGMTVGVNISLDSRHDYVTLSPWVKNTSGAAQQFQYWLNAMVTLGGNHVSGQTRLIFPANEVIVHSTGDESLPGAWQPLPWPVYEGRDLSHYGTWQNYLGFFVPQVNQGFVALYDPAAEQGIVRNFTPGWPVGTKFFGPGTLPSWLWTDDDSSYIELWSGVTPTFGDTTTLAAGESLGWTERWYPVHRLGGVAAANANAALHLETTGGGVKIGCTVTAPTQGSLTLWINGEAVEVWDVLLTPLQTLATTWTGSGGADGSLGLTLTGANGERLVQAGSVP